MVYRKQCKQERTLDSFVYSCVDFKETKKDGEKDSMLVLINK